MPSSILISFPFDVANEAGSIFSFIFISLISPIFTSTLFIFVPAGKMYVLNSYGRIGLPGLIKFGKSVSITQYPFLCKNFISEFPRPLPIFSILKSNSVTTKMATSFFIGLMITLLFKSLLPFFPSVLLPWIEKIACCGKIFLLSPFQV